MLKRHLFREHDSLDKKSREIDQQARIHAWKPEKADSPVISNDGEKNFNNHQKSFIPYNFDNAQSLEVILADASKKEGVDKLRHAKGEPKSVQEFYNWQLVKLGFSDKRRQEIQKRYIDEENRKILAKNKTSLREDAANISLAKDHFLECVEKLYEKYTGYPEYDDFAKFNKDAVAWAQQKDKTSQLRNEALAFIAEEGEIDFDITKTSEFKAVVDLFSKPVNTKDSLNDIEKTISKLPNLIASLESGNVEKYEQEIKDVCAKQIMIAKRRYKDFEGQKEQYEKIEGEIKEYNEPAVRDTSQQARERAQQAQKRAQQAQKRAQQAAIRVQEAKGRASFSIDTELSNASLAVVESARKMEALEYKSALLAENIFNVANSRATELEKNPEKCTIDENNNMITDEQTMFQKEKNALLEIRNVWKEEIASLEAEKKAFSEYEIKYITETENIDENKNKKQLDQISSSKKIIDNTIKNVRSKLLEVEKKLVEHDKIDIQYQSLKTGLCAENIKIEAIQAKSMYEQYNKREEKNVERSKNHERQIKMFEAYGYVTPDEFSNIHFAQQMAVAEKNIKNAYFTIAEIADKIIELQNSSSDNKQEDIDKYQKMIQKAKKWKELNLSKIQDIYEKDLKAIRYHKETARVFSGSAERDVRTLIKLQKSLAEASQEQKRGGITPLVKVKLKKYFTRSKKILKANSSHVKYMMKNDIDQATKYLDTIPDSLLKGKDVQDVIDRSEAHVIFYKDYVAFNGVLMRANEIRSFKFDEETKTVTAVWREEAVKVNIFGNEEYMKRMSSFDINTKNRTISFKIPDNTYKNGERGKIILEDYNYEEKNRSDKDITTIGTEQAFESIVIQPQEKGNSSSIASTDATSSEGSDVSGPSRVTPNRQEYEAKSLKSVTVRSHEKQEGDIELSYCVEVKTLPDNTIKLDNKISFLTREQLQRGTRINFNTQEVFSDNNIFKYKIDQIDLDETIRQEVTTVHETDPVFMTGMTYRKICLPELGRLSHFIGELTGRKEDLKMQTRNHAKDCLDNLKGAIKTGNRDIIQSSLASVQETYGLAVSKTSEIKYKLKDPPKSKQDFDRMHSSLNNTLERISKSYDRDMQGMYEKFYDLNRKVKNDVIAIHKKYPLTAQEVQNYDKNSQDYEKHAGSAAKKELLKEIYSAYHFDKTYSFDLLVDGEVKCSNPNGLMLIEEYDIYANKKDRSSEEERYMQSIEDFVEKNDDVYLRNSIFIRKAKQLENSDEGGNKLNQLFIALGKISSGDRSDVGAGPESLKDFRQNAEYHWGDFIHRAIAMARDAGNDHLIRGFVHVAARVEQDRLRILKLAEDALNPEIPSDIAIRAIENEPVDTPALSTQTAKKAKQDLSRVADDFELKIDKLIQAGLKNPEEYAKGAEKLVWEMALKGFQSSIELIDDPDLKQEIKKNAHVLIRDMVKGHRTANEKAFNVKFYFQSMERQMRVWLLYSLTIALASNMAIELKAFNDRIGTSFTRFCADLGKMMGL